MIMSIHSSSETGCFGRGGNGSTESGVFIVGLGEVYLWYRLGVKVGVVE